MTVQKGGRQILIHGLVFVLAGLLWGLVVPHTPYPRLALGAHIQFGLSGILFIVMAILLLTLPHRIGPRSVFFMILSAWLTWAMVLSEAANAWWGTSQILPIAASQAGAKGAEPWQELVLQVTHIAGAIGLIVAWTLLLIGIARKSGDTK